MATSSDKVIIEVGLNENQSRHRNRHVPYSPAEIADVAQRCYDAGASIVHYHGRHGEAGEPALSDPKLNVEAQRRITETTPLIAYPSYGSEVRVLDYYDIGTPAPERYRHFTELGIERESQKNAYFSPLLRANLGLPYNAEFVSELECEPS